MRNKKLKSELAAVGRKARRLYKRIEAESSMFLGLRRKGWECQDWLKDGDDVPDVDSPWVLGDLTASNIYEACNMQKASEDKKKQEQHDLMVQLLTERGWASSSTTRKHNVNKFKLDSEGYLKWKDITETQFETWSRPHWDGDEGTYKATLRDAYRQQCKIDSKLAEAN